MCGKRDGGFGIESPAAEDGACVGGVGGMGGVTVAMVGAGV